MYMHLGDDFVVSTREIVAIFDYKAKTSPIVEEFLNKQKQQIVSSNSTPKSIVVTLQSIYFSPLASGTLKKRAQSKPEIDS
ncbi:extracellular matrix regulator RemB [Bacillus paralicheniformis]|uniref:extracellular matrix regulator RemB n=1 Tax=Bacillus paralicheniformis TaxID=1648923 RepID=UPI0011A583F1|nr:extracellular matrix/biofilm biosynthesis regulator RemA family protein [Bacillus paralicheniformis]